MAETPGQGARPAAEEYRQLHRRLTEQVLERAAADPQWRQLYLDDPQAATAEFPEAERLRQIVEEMPIRRNLNEMVLDKATSSPEWKQLLLEDPPAAMRELAMEMVEVSGQVGGYLRDKGGAAQLGGLSLATYQPYDIYAPSQHF
jgi:hypothetical protein